MFREMVPDLKQMMYKVSLKYLHQAERETYPNWWDRKVDLKEQIRDNLRN